MVYLEPGEPLENESLASSDMFDDFPDDEQPQEDAADYFLVKINRKFPGLNFATFKDKDWRLGWFIKVPPQQSVTEVREAAIELQDLLYLQKDILVPFIVRGNE